MNQESGAGRVYYGWWLVAGLFVVLTVSSGLGFYNLSVYIAVLSQARGFAVSEVSAAASIFFISGGFAGMAVARLMERRAIRGLMVAGAALAAAALALIGQAATLAELYLLFAVFGIGNASVSIVTSTTLVTRWFPGPDRAVALSVASTGLSMGGVVLTPASAAWFEAFGVAATTSFLGALFFVVIAPVAWWLVREPPGTDDSGAPARFTAASPAAPVVGYREAVRSRFFVVLSLAYVVCMTAQVGGIAHLFNQGLTVAGPQTAARAVQVLTLMSILMRVAGGWILRSVPIARFALINAALQALGLTVISLADGAAAVLIGAGLFGGSVGNLLMLQPLWLAERFGGVHYARIFALSNAVSVAGVALGPLLLGVLFDWHGYPLAYGTAACLSVGAMALLAMLPTPIVGGRGA